MGRIIDTVIRVLVGGLFIFSGLIKLNDPIGTEIKLEEYFEVFSSDFASFFEIFIPYALEIAMIIIVLEVVLGVAVLINYKMDKTTWVLLLMILFFSFLTFYSAYFNKVTDCGCFGDAIPLDPWESFIKDVILFVLIAHLFWYRHRFTPLFRSLSGHAVMVAITALCFFIGVYALNHLPFIDFRPYKVGKNIPQQMLPEESPIIEYIFEKDGETIQSKKFLKKKDGYKYVGSDILNEDKSTPKITDYSVFGVNGEDFTATTFEGAKLFVAMYDVRYADHESMKAINAMVEKMDDVISPMVLTASGEKAIEALRHEYQVAIPYYFVDATVLKAMIRSNPGILLLKNGTVLGKWHFNDVPSAEEVNALL